MALSELRDKGLIRNIGVSNFVVKHLEELQGVGAPIANNQINYHPFVPDHVQETVAYCKKYDITITAYSPLGKSCIAYNIIWYILCFLGGYLSELFSFRWNDGH